MIVSILNSEIGDYVESTKTNLAYLVGSSYLMPGWKIFESKEVELKYGFILTWKELRL